VNVTATSGEQHTAILSIKIEQADYQPRIEEALKNLRKKVDLKGFRKGMVPPGLVKKMYGTGVLAEELDKMINEQLDKHIKDNNINMLGQPLPKHADQQNIDINSLGDFEFAFEIGMAPAFELPYISKKTVATRYKIAVDNVIVNEEVDALRKRFGTTTNPEDGAVEETDVIVVKLQELEGKKVKEGGIENSTAIGVDMLTDEAKKEVVGLTLGASADVNIFNFLAGKTQEEAAKHLLNVTEGYPEGAGDKYRVTLEKINRQAPGELNQELFDQVFGPGAVEGEEAFLAKLSEEIEKSFDHEAEQKFGYDLLEQMLDQTEIALPDDFLKRWIKHSNEKPVSDEQIAEEFDAFARSLRYQLIVNKISKDNDIKVSQEEIKDRTRQQIYAQYAQYFGGMDVDKVLDEWADGMLKKREHVEKTYQQVLDEKLIAFIKEQVSIDEKTVSLEEFKNLNKPETV
jgi:trigger factor